MRPNVALIVRWSRLASLGVLVAAASAGVSGRSAQDTQPPLQPPAFRSGVDFVPLSVTVTDRNGRFVPGLKRENFRVFEDGQEQPIVHFGTDRVPVSLGLALDTSDSMRGLKLIEARAGLGRFLGELLGPNDEICLYRFSDRPALVTGWTTDRDLLRAALGEVRAGGATALLDTVAEALPMVETGQRLKRVLVIISDGRDTASVTHPDRVAGMIRDSDVLIYAIGIDGRARAVVQTAPQRVPPRQPAPRPIPIPRGGRGGRGPGGGIGGGVGGVWPGSPPDNGPGSGVVLPPPGAPSPYPPGAGGGSSIAVVNSERVDAGALRDLTDISGGRTEIIRSTADLGPATSGIADELNRQYLIGYQAPTPRDGRWHEIRVEIKGRWGVTVRTRKGYRASQLP